MLVFEERENQSTRRKSSWSKDENQQQTQPTHDGESGNQIQFTLVGGKCFHYCTNSLALLSLFFHGVIADVNAARRYSNTALPVRFNLHFDLFH